MHFLQLLERMLTLPYCSIKEEYVLKFRRKMEDQSKKQKVEPLQLDENGVAFCKGEGKTYPTMKVVPFSCLRICVQDLFTSMELHV